MEESEEELKGFLMKVKEESEKAGLKLSIQKMRIMASGPITSWQVYGKTMETLTFFIFLGSIITADGYCSHAIKTLAPWKKSYDTPRQHIKKQRQYFTYKRSSLVKAVIFPGVVYRCESWTIKKVACQRTDVLNCGAG